MKILKFAQQVTKREGLKQELSIAQILEVLSVINTLLKGILYKAIREIKE